MGKVYFEAEEMEDQNGDPCWFFENEDGEEYLVGSSDNERLVYIQYDGGYRTLFLCVDDIPVLIDALEKYYDYRVDKYAEEQS